MKITLDKVASPYYQELRLNNGLTASDINELKTELTEKGFENITVNYSQVGTVAYQDQMIIEIKTSKPIKLLNWLEFTYFSVNLDYIRKPYAGRIEL